MLEYFIVLTDSRALNHKNATLTEDQSLLVQKVRMVGKSVILEFQE